MDREWSQTFRCAHSRRDSGCHHSRNETPSTWRGIISKPMERDYTPNPDKHIPHACISDRLQRIIRELHDSNGFPADYTAASMMAAISVTIGNSHRVEVKRNWHESVILYIAIVGRPEACKSHPLAFAMQPLVNADWKNNLDYQKKYSEYQQAMAMSRKERVHAGFEQFRKSRSVCATLCRMLRRRG